MQTPVGPTVRPKGISTGVSMSFQKFLLIVSVRPSTYLFYIHALSHGYILHAITLAQLHLLFLLHAIIKNRLKLKIIILIVKMNFMVIMSSIFYFKVFIVYFFFYAITSTFY